MATTKIELYNNGALVATKTTGDLTTIQWTPPTSGSLKMTIKRFEDGLLAQESDVVNYTVSAANVSPTTTADSYNATENTTLTVAAPGVLSNDTDPESDSLTAILVSTTSNGALTLNSDGSFEYIPNTDYVGPDSFQYKTNDGFSDGNTVTVDITVDAQVVTISNISTGATNHSLSASTYKIENHLANDIMNTAFVYRNGKTITGYVRNTDNRLGIIEYDSNYGLRPVHIIKGAGGVYDLHDLPAFRYLGNRLQIVQEKSHNINRKKLHEAAADNDSLIINNNVSDIGATNPMTYTSIHEQGGKVVDIGQYNDTEAGYVFTLDNTLKGTWSDNLLMVPRYGDESERYQQSISNPSYSDYILITSSGRNDVPAEPTWFRLNLFKAKINANGYLDFYNMDGTLMKTGSAGSTAIGTTELATTEIIALADTTKTIFIPVFAMDKLGNAHVIYGDGTSTGKYKYTVWKDGVASPVTKDITFPDSPTLVEPISQTGACQDLVVFAPDNIHAFFKVNNGTRDIVRNYKSIDEGTTWTFVQDIDFGINVVSFKLPNNAETIPNNTNFIVGASANAASPREYVFKKAAFGTIQPETNIYDSLTPVSDASFNATAVCSYFYEEGKITRTGTTLNTVIDQSPNNRDRSVLGSPVLNDGTNPTYVTFDAVDDGISLDPAWLVAGKAYLFISVSKSTGNFTGSFTITNTVNNDNYITLNTQATGSGKAIQHGSKHGEVNYTEITGDEPREGTSFHIAAWLLRGELHDIPMIYDGQLQHRNIVNEERDREGSYILPSGNTNLEINRLVRTSVGYYGSEHKHSSIHEVTSEAEILDKIKYLSNKYGITLKNYYR